MAYQLLVIFLGLMWNIGGASSSNVSNCSSSCHHNQKIEFVDFSDASNSAAILVDEDRLEWSENRRLTWNDFQAYPPSPRSERWTANVAAITSSVIQYSYVCENGYLKYSVKSIFLQDESWVKDNARTEDYLKHEQLHFDITEVFARKLKNKMLGRKFKCNETHIFERITNEVLSDWRNFQRRYDLETDYSLDTYRQGQWDDYIDRLLNVYDKY